MRQGEILNLTWDSVGFANGVIRLKPEDTKANDGRIIPLTPELIRMLRDMPSTIHGKVFTLNGKPIGEIKTSFVNACRNAKIEKFTFHDLRYTRINNPRLGNHDFFRITAASGHKTMEVFRRHNTVTEEEVKKLVSKEA
jgi:integrase